MHEIAQAVVTSSSLCLMHFKSIEDSVCGEALKTPLPSAGAQRSTVWEGLTSEHFWKTLQRWNYL